MKTLLTNFLIDKVHFLDSPFRRTNSGTSSNYSENNYSPSHKKEVEVLVLSDLHLGTYGSQTKELYQYLQTISPKKVILNGDIIDMWLFSKNK
ncbi:MAG: hypothetical protein GY827_08345 [Cytophagales bacterium]|nr:hypothetical protein [Cytophagales bacterium]